MNVYLDLRDSPANVDGIIIDNIISTYSLRYLIKAKDNLLCTMSFNRKLSDEREKVLKHFLDKLKESKNKNPVFALKDRTEFRFKFLLARFLQENLPEMGIFVQLLIDDSYKLFWEKAHYSDVYRNDTASLFSKKEVSDLLNKGTFRIAKTMPKNPHSYTLRKSWDENTFYEVSSYLRNNCILEWMFGSYWRVTHIGKYKYWTHPIDITNSDVDLINRAEL